MAAFARFACGVLVMGLLSAGPCHAGEHPAIDSQANCLECHADHAAGAYVHPAVKRGCTACHLVEERENATYIRLKTEKSIVCQECHQTETFARVHFPYDSAMCMRCHNPHSAEQPKLLRAKVNDLCLSCHLRTPEGSPSQFLPTIALTMNESMGHPYERHPVSGSRDPLTGTEMSCISCHLPHGGTKLHHLKMGSEIPEDVLNQNTEIRDMCHKCHLRLWGLDNLDKKGRKKRN